ncbi:hypothetical protein BHQ15_02070 [Mycolicibacillus koreensis]|nr:hypothetical protein BHQ15_02070 [Mycolicibacillus koreensis]
MHALRGVDLDVADGSLTAVLGPSGCGKTTLLRILAGFDRPDTGEVWIGGRRVAGPGAFIRPERRSVGVVAQEGALFPHMTVAANIAYGVPVGAGFDVDGRRRRRARVQEMLELVGLPDLGDRRPDELSGGQQQRVALARALAPGPAVLLLDEPFSALDAALRVGLREEVRDLLRSIGATAVLVTHDQDEALSLADQVAIMRDGTVVQAGTPAGVYAQPADPETAAFLGDSMELNVRWRPSSEAGRVDVDCPLGALRVAASAIHPPVGSPVGEGPEGTSARLVLRPEQLMLAGRGAPGTVLTASFFGRDGLVRVALADGTRLLVRLDGRAMPVVGERVRVRAVPELEITPPMSA